jgi:AcrR family transcriptional regulator
LELFWTKGFEGTSLMDLVTAMGIKKPSLYAAFGSKEELFFEVLNLYQQRLGAVALPAFALPSARQAIEAYLRALATFQSASGTPKGCLLVQGALVCSDDSHKVAKLLAEVRETGVAMIKLCLERARAQGELPKGTDLKRLARYFGTVSHGISVQAAGGVSTNELYETIKIAMRSWPTAPDSKNTQAAKGMARGPAS